MQIGLRIPGAGANSNPADIVTIARWAEELGYHSVWISDHVALPQPEAVKSYYPYDPEGQWRAPADTPFVDPLLVLAWAAAVAPSLKLGTSVLVAPLRHPVLLAKQLASLDHLSGGRVLFGVGAGWMKEEFNVMGVPFKRRGSRTAEMVELMRQLWTGETVDFEGEFYQVSGVQMHPPPAQGPIPIIWGGHSDYALKRVARLGDGWHPTLLPLEQLAECTERLQTMCDEYGREFESLQIIVRPGSAYAITAETQVRHQALGVTHLVIDLPLTDLPACRADMERMAELGGLTRRDF